MRVVERRLALARAAHGGVDVDVVGRMLEHALDRPTPLVGPEERGIAVRAEQGRAVVRRQQRRPLEADEVGDDPGHQDGDRRRDEHARARQPSTDPRCGITSQGGRTIKRQREHRDEQHQLAARERREATQRTEHEERSRVGATADDNAMGAQQHRAHGEHAHALRHHQTVVDPQVRVRRGDDRGDDADPFAADRPSQQPDHDDRGRSADHRDQPLVRDRIVHPTDRGHQDRRQRAVLGGRQVVEHLAEEATLVSCFAHSE